MQFERVQRSRWTLPAFSVCIGVVFLIAATFGGSVWLGLQMLAVMTVCGLLFLLGGRSETIRGLRGDGRDERFASIDLRATAYSGLVLIAVLLGAFVVEVARGEDGQPYSWMGAVSGVAYVVFVLLLRWRD